MQRLTKIHGFLAYLTIVFINAFVDLGHKIVIQNTLLKVYDGQTQVILGAIVNALILLPFILLFSTSGWLSDRFSKPKVMRYSALAAIIITLLITFSYAQNRFIVAFALTFILAVQSALYSPAKYGYIRERVGEQRLAEGNAMVQAVTIVAILGGTAVFSYFFEYFYLSVVSTDDVMSHMTPIGWVLVALSVIEYLLTFRLPDSSVSKDQAGFSTGALLRGDYLRNNLRIVRAQPAIWLSIIGLSIFWGISQAILAVFPAFAELKFATSNAFHINLSMGWTGIGIVIGSWVAGRASRKHVELGLVPVAAMGITLGLFAMVVVKSLVLASVAFFVIGFFGALLIVPLNSLIQYHAPKEKLGSVLAGNNWIQNLVMVAFLGLTIAFALLDVSMEMLLTIIAFIGFGGAIYTLYQLPHSFARLVFLALFRRKYRLTIQGFDKLPQQGGVLLLGNHISWIDWLIVQMACPRPVRFVMLRSIYERKFLTPVLRLFGVIPISQGNSAKSLEAVNNAIAAGEVVCLFPEGAISNSGQLGAFRGGYERAVEGLEEGVIVPFYIHGMWGSRLSRAHNEKFRANKSTGGKRQIILGFGDALPLDTKTDALKSAVAQLSIDAWAETTRDLGSIPEAWIRQAKLNPNKTAVIDNLTGQKLSHGKLMAATFSFAQLLRKTDKCQNIGLLLPSSPAGVIANLAVMLNGQAAVNLNFTAATDAIVHGLKQADVNTILTSKRFVEKLAKKGVNTEALAAQSTFVYMEDLKEQVGSLRALTNLVLSYVLPSRFLLRLFGGQLTIDAPAQILFSSGSEGMPKGIMLSHFNLLSNVKQVAEMLNPDERDVMVSSLPIFHSFGLTVTTLLPVIEGVPALTHPDPTDVQNIAKGVYKHEATILCGTATFLRLYARNQRILPAMLDSLRLVIAGAEKLSEEVRNQFELKFKKTVYEGYGATETTPVATVNMPDRMIPGTLSLQVGQKPGTVGLPVPGTAIRIIDPQTRESLKTGEQGLIVISGVQVMQGYLNNEEKTRAVLIEIDGRTWYDTGDKGFLDADGFLTIVDRYSRFAKIGGEMISLSAVENGVIDGLKKSYADAEVSVVAVAVPDAGKGEKVVLLVEHNEHGAINALDITTLRKLLLEAKVNPLLIPAAVYPVAQIPLLGSGKKDFSAVKKLALELIG